MSGGAECPITDNRVEVLKLNSPDPPPSKLGTIQLVQSILHVAARPKLGNSLSTPVLMSVCVADFACLTHKILQVLPGGRGREVLNDHAIASLGTRRPPAPPTPVAISTSEVTSSTATSAASCVLNTDSSSIKVFSIKILNITREILEFQLLTKTNPKYHLDNVFGITAIFKLCKPKTLLRHY